MTFSSRVRCRPWEGGNSRGYTKGAASPWARAGGHVVCEEDVTRTWAERGGESGEKCGPFDLTSRRHRKGEIESRSARLASVASAPRLVRPHAPVYYPPRDFACVEQAWAAAILASREARRRGCGDEERSGQLRPPSLHAPLSLRGPLSPTASPTQLATLTC